MAWRNSARKPQNSYNAGYKGYKFGKKNTPRLYRGVCCGKAWASAGAAALRGRV